MIAGLYADIVQEFLEKNPAGISGILYNRK